MGRKIGLSRRINYVAAALPLILYLCVDDTLRSLLQHILSEASLGWISGSLALWWWLLTAVAAVVWVRTKVSSRFEPKRRAFLTASTAALCAAPAAALGAGVILRKDFHVAEIDLQIRNLPKDLQGLRLVQLSDIHMGDFFSARDVTRVVDASNELRGDLVFITGDLITTKWDPLDRCLLELAKLRSASGLWGCLGNHELFAKVQNYTTAEARKLGIQFLRHESVPLKFGNDWINLVGVDYQRRNKPYLTGVEDLVARGTFNLLLSHNPDVFPVAARKGFDLTLAGHTHGGQINLSVAGMNLNMADFVTPYTKGLYTLPNSQIYVNSGLGTIGVPLRLGAPPEITLIRLCNTSS